MLGRIIKNISNDYTVKTDNKVYLCKASGNLRQKKQTPLVGDYVEFDENKQYIIKIQQRKNELVRPSVANIDIAIIVTSVKKPDFDSITLDKTLTIVSYNNITPIIYFTKLDLLDNKEYQEIKKYLDYYQKIGYLVITTKEELLTKIKNKTVVLTGQSGAGKSTLLNKINPSLNLKTDEISQALGRGKHTTRHTELFETNNSYIVDTPGFSKIDITTINKIAIRDNMKEFFDNIDKCKYQDCMHLTEDGCYVKLLLEKKEILPSRYRNYQLFIKESKL